MSACAGLKDVTKFDKKDAILSLKKGSCYGKCSVYNVDVYKNRHVVYEGIKNVEKYGLYARKISKQELEALKKAYDAADFFSFKDQYPTQIADLPLITMMYKKEKESKTIIGSIDRPQALLDLQKLMENLVKGEGWTLIKAYETQTTQEVVEDRKVVQNEIIDSQILIEPNSNVFLAEWIKKYGNYNVQLIKRVSDDLNYWLITYNKQKISPADMMEMLKLDSDLKFVEFNKRIQPRDH